MADMLANDSNGNARFAHADVNPWHSKGKNVKKATTSDEMIVEAGLDITVEKEPLLLADGTVVEGFFANRMTEAPRTIFGVVGSRHTNLQPREAFDFTDSLVKDGSIRYTTAGMLTNGKIWILCQPKEDTIEIVKGDPIKSRILLSTGFDGQTVTECRTTSITVVCNNTLNMAVAEGQSSVLRIRHTVSQKEKLKVAAEIMSGHHEQQKTFVEALKFLAGKKLTNDLIQAFEIKMFGDINEAKDGRGKTMLSNKLEQFEHLMVSGKGTEIPGRVGNAYGLLQAFTEWTDWMSQVKGTDDRTNSIVFANGAKAKTEALDTLLALVK